MVAFFLYTLYSILYTKFSAEMEESLNDIDEQDMLPVLDVRVLDGTKKSKFRVRRLINFPLAETMDEMKSACKYLCQTSSTLRIAI